MKKNALLGGERIESQTFCYLTQPPLQGRVKQQDMQFLWNWLDTGTYQPHYDLAVTPAQSPRAGRMLDTVQFQLTLPPHASD
jgi:hypothetical protein